MSNLKVVTINSVTSTTGVPELRVRRVDRDLLGEARDVRQDLAGKAGSWNYPEEMGDRTIVVHGWLQAESISAKRTAIHNLADWCRTTAEVSLSVDDETDRYYLVTLDKWDVDTSMRYPSVTLTFVGSPFGFATSESTQSEAVSGAGSDSGSFNITDDVAAEPVIEVTPTNGTMTSFQLTVNGASVSWTGLLADDQTITISSLSQTVTTGVNTDVNLTGAFDPNDVDMETVTVSAAGFPELVNGSNAWSISWTGTATTATIEFTWRKRFI